MNLKITGKANMRMCIDFIEYRNKRGELISINWKESSTNKSEITLSGGSFTGTYFDLEFGAYYKPYPEGGWNEILDISEIETIQVYNYDGHTNLDCFIPTSITFYHEYETHTLSNPKVGRILYL